MIKLLIHGIQGAMGLNVYNLAKESGKFEIYGFDRSTDFKDVKVYNDLSNIDVEMDLIIDFSHYSLIDNLLEYANNTKTPLVLCTTGLEDTTEKKIIDYKNNFPIFQSGNMSLGINVLIELAKIGARSLKGFDIEIIERHHNKKVDAPSGTAYMIADGIKEEKENSVYNFGRHGNNAKREENEIGIHAVRGGTITGDHTVLFAGVDEVIELKHQATSKAVFAKGSIEAGLFLINKEKGLYNMTNLILGGQ